MGGVEHGRKGLLQRIAKGWPMASLGIFQRGALAVLTRLDRLGRLQRLFVLWVIGAVALALATWLCLQLDLSFAAAAFAFLIIIVFLSLLDSFISSAIFSAIAIGSLNFFFVEPRHTFIVGSPQDLITLTAFLMTSLAVTSLIRQVRDLGEAQREQVRLLDLTSDAIVVRDTDDVITYWNRGAEALYGWERKEAVGRVAHDLLQTVFPAPLPEIADTLSRTGRWEGELIHTRRAGSKISVASRWAQQRDDRGLAVGTLESNTDITERRRTEDALRRSQAAYLAEAQKLSLTGSFGWNVSSGEIFWSDETFRIFEHEPTKTPSLEIVRQRTHPDDAALVQDVLGRAAQAGEDFDVEHRLLMPDGSIKHLHVVAHGTPDEQGRLQFVGAIMDITAQKNAFAALERSEQRFRQLFDHMPIALMRMNGRRTAELVGGLRAKGVTDLSAYLDAHPDFLQTCMEAFIIEEVNEHTVQMFGGRDAGDLVGRSCAFWWKTNPDTFRRSMESRFRGETRFEEETKLNTLDGRVVDVLLAISRMGPASDPTISLVGLTDISQRIRAQERLQQVQADFAHAARVSVLGELTASIAHEINQPLAAIAANGGAGLRWLDRPNPDLTEVRELTESIVADTQRAAAIIARIRAMAARREPEQALVSLDDIIREALLFLRQEVQARAVTVSHYPAQAAPQVFGDRTQLQQVIVNLAINAMQAMTHSGGMPRRIRISTGVPDPATLSCTVEDSGPGVRPEHLSRLFESFFTTKEGGMGMGLPICRSIIEAHGGRIEADNGGAEGGARFSFTLPAASGPH